MIGGQDFVARFQIKRAGDDIHPIGCIGDKNQVAGFSVKIFRQSQARLEIVVEVFAPEKLDRLLLQATLPGLIDLEDGTRAGAKRAVVQKYNFGVEQEEIFDVRDQ